MTEGRKDILKKGNAAIAEGDYEAFVSLCAEDTEWVFVGDRTLKGKEEVRNWMKETYVNPPTIVVADLIAEGDLLVANGEVIVTDKAGNETRNTYCDIWQFSGEKIVNLRAFVV